MILKGGKQIFFFLMGLKIYLKNTIFRLCKTGLEANKSLKTYFWPPFQFSSLVNPESHYKRIWTTSMFQFHITVLFQFVSTTLLIFLPGTFEL